MSSCCGGRRAVPPRHPRRGGGRGALHEVVIGLFVGVKRPLGGAESLLVLFLRLVQLVERRLQVRPDPSPLHHVLQREESKKIQTWLRNNIFRQSLWSGFRPFLFKP